jgi:hypothetical protein
MKPTIKIVLDYDSTTKRDAAKNALIGLIPDGVLYASVSVAAKHDSVNPTLSSFTLWANGVPALDDPDVIALTTEAEKQLALAEDGSRVWQYEAAETKDEENVFLSRRLKSGGKVVDD